jgi:homoserine O-acetyltransferase/O-succinyltransferase
MIAGQPMKTFFLSIIIYASVALAQAPLEFHEIGDFPLECGDTLYDCRVGFRTVGELNAAKDNAILFPTWFAGTSEHVVSLVSPEKLLDPEGFFVVIVDALGNGVSTSPSNSARQPGGEFPTIAVRDMAASQRRLVEERFGITKLHAVVGGSMGGMQTFEWMVSYPDMMKKAIPYVGSTKRSAYDLTLMRLQKDVIDVGKRHSVPDSTIMGEIRTLQALVSRTPDWLDREVAYENHDEFYAAFWTNHSETFTVDNWRAQLVAMLRHNVYAPYGDSAANAAARVTAETLVIVSRQDHIVYPGSALEFADMIDAETLVLDDDAGHLAVGAELPLVSAAVNAFLREEPFLREER